jgi:tRNA 2-selenouridine synthase
LSLLTDDFRSIVINNTPLLDVRAPVEFTQGSFVNAVNFPILTDKERELVGIRYKANGNAAAMVLAEELIKQTGKQERVLQWRAFIKENPSALLYCFRGGQRSGIAQAWLEEEGIAITRLNGGYKKFRNFLMEESERISSKLDTIIIGGRTGSGKTILLLEVENMIDLEGLANHRGSSFGNFALSQPAQIDFENNLAYKLIQFEEKGFSKLVIEHESHHIGRAFIPKPVFHNLMAGNLVILETPMDVRVDITHNEYVTEAINSYTKMYGDDGFKEWSDDVNKSLEKIKKRLGSELHIELKKMFDEANQQYLLNRDIVLYKKWIEKLLVNYYDPMYDYQIKQTAIPIVFRGNEKEVLAYIKSQD